MMKGFKHAVREIRTRHRKDAYRAVYVVNLEDKIYVLHVFQKKSNTGISTPKTDMALIRKRLKQAEEDAKKGKK